MSGRRINDHSFWAGSKSKASVFPEGVKSKAYSSAEGAGAEMDYEDTTEKIQSQQQKGKAQAKSHEMKPLYRN
jgi:hypothetical protein